MTRDYKELISERVHKDPDFAAGLYQDCIALLQSHDDEDQAVANETLANYFDDEQARAARQLAAEATKQAATTAD